MKRFALWFVAALLVGSGLNVREANAADDLQFATPAVKDYSPACANGNCPAAISSNDSSVYPKRRRPVIHLIQQLRPARRVVHGVVNLLGCR